MVQVGTVLLLVDLSAKAQNGHVSWCPRATEGFLLDVVELARQLTWRGILGLGFP